ncbi:MAG: polysaccharide pyruvyl transferase family protein, partial [Actinomycetota bacterium]|nr:polysaccharide pyruvyl transferase family protein [Actinomycetota bacterium]
RRGLVVRHVPSGVGLNGAGQALRRPAVAIWGTFDVDNYGDHLFPLVARLELSARIPDVVVDAYSPFGSEHPTRLDGAVPTRSLGVRTDARMDEFADAYDAVLVGGGELLHLDDVLLRHFYAVEPAALDAVRPSGWFVEGLGAQREATCPVLWHGLGVPYDFDAGRAERVRAALAHRSWSSVRDQSSAERLRRAGVALAPHVVPDSALLVDRLVEAPERAQRVAAMQARGALPVGPAMVLQGCDLLVPWAPAIAAALAPRLAEGDVSPVLLETGRCRDDGAFADALSDALGGRVYRVPPSASMEDIVSVLASARSVVASSLHAAITAVAFRRPFVVLNLGAESKLDGFGDQCGFRDRVLHDVGDLAAAVATVGDRPPADEQVRRLQTEVDRHFDDVAAIVTESRARRHPAVTRKLGGLRGRLRSLAVGAHSK